MATGASEKRQEIFLNAADDDDDDEDDGDGDGHLPLAASSPVDDCRSMP